MKRLLVLTLAGLACLGLLGCAPDDEAALTVDGDEVLTVGDLEDRLDAIAGNDEFLTAYGARGSGAGTIDAGFTTTILTQEVYSAVLAQELEAEGVEVSDGDRTSAEETVTQILTTGSPETGVAPIQPADAPSAYVEAIELLYSRFFALAGALSDDPAQGQELAGARLGELLVGLDVDVAERYGSWEPLDEETQVGGEVVAPEGPVTPTTIMPPAVPAG